MIVSKMSVFHPDLLHSLESEEFFVRPEGVVVHSGVHNCYFIIAEKEILDLKGGVSIPSSYYNKCKEEFLLANPIPASLEEEVAAFNATEWLYERYVVHDSAEDSHEVYYYVDPITGVKTQDDFYGRAPQRSAEREWLALGFTNKVHKECTKAWYIQHAVNFKVYKF